jgi:threonine dehydrogenase-like Zn-dependent dehydrogenase
VRAVTWQGVNHVSVQSVPDARLLADEDAVVAVRLSSVVGTDIHLLDGYVPGVRRGDVLGREFVGDVVEVGRRVRRFRPGQRVVASGTISCGGCWYCRQGLSSLCDNSNAQPEAARLLWGAAPAGRLGGSRLLGGFSGGHAEYVRVPFADTTLAAVPDEVGDAAAVFAGDTVPTGWAGAQRACIEPGDVVAVWGGGAVGQVAASTARLLGAGDVVVIDPVPERLQLAEQTSGALTLQPGVDDVAGQLDDLTAGRGPDRCIEAVGVQRHATGSQYAYDRLRQVTGLDRRRQDALGEAVRVCRKGGTVVALGEVVGPVDAVPLGALVNKAITLRTAENHGQRTIPTVLALMAVGQLDPGHLLTHRMHLEAAPRGYEVFRARADGCVRVVFDPVS